MEAAAEVEDLKDQEDLAYLQDDEDDEELIHLLHLLPLQGCLHLLHRGQDLQPKFHLKPQDDLKVFTSIRRSKRATSSRLGQEKPTSYPTIF